MPTQGNLMKSFVHLGMVKIRAMYNHISSDNNCKQEQLEITSIINCLGEILRNGDSTPLRCFFSSQIPLCLP